MAVWPCTKVPSSSAARSSISLSHVSKSESSLVTWMYRMVALISLARFCVAARSAAHLASMSSWRRRSRTPT